MSSSAAAGEPEITSYPLGFDVVLKIDEPILNVIVFICLSLKAFPVLEVLTDMIICRRGTLALLQGKRVCLCDTRFGVLTLYSTYFGQRRHLCFLILLGSMVIATEMFTEVCLSSTQVKNVETVRVWREANRSGTLNPLFLDAFKSNGSYEFNIAPLENDLFVFQTSAMLCVTGEFQLKLKNLVDEDRPRDMVSRPHTSSGPVVVSRAYLREDNVTVCDYSDSIYTSVEFEMPATVKHGKSLTTLNVNWTSLLGDEIRIAWGPRLRIGNSLHSTYRGDGLVCVGVNEVGHDLCPSATERVVCIFVEDDKRSTDATRFAYGEGYMLRNQDGLQKSNNHTSCADHNLVLDINVVRMLGKTERFSVSYQAPRLTIFLMTLVTEGFVGLSENEMLEKKRVLYISRMFLIAARYSFLSKDAIDGLREELEREHIQMEGLSQAPTISILAYVPLALLGSTVLLQIIFILYSRRRISVELKGQNCDERFDTSMQYLRLDLLRTLLARGVEAELCDVALRLVRQGERWRIQLLPDLSSLKRPNTVPETVQ